jgi:hypothetical protein
VYIYREESDPPPGPSMRDRPEEDAAYWYDLRADDAVPENHETRGPFEPLVTSSVPPAAASVRAAAASVPPAAASVRAAGTVVRNGSLAGPVIEK